MNTNTGGPAFPFEYFDEQLQRARVMHGMTLRDYFAAKAMQGLLAGITPTTVWSHDEVAETAYNVADAMLRAREAT
jgi:hypothetical protein